MSDCPHCGAALEDDALPDGLCPHCLLELGLTDETTEPTAESDLANRDAGQFGPYQTVRVLGEGGMGIVYLAEQKQPLRRLVALKVIKLGMNSREVMARFGSERQALARMDHPNIARVFDAGVSDQGQPYFAMELVSGTHVTDYCDTHRLNIRERLELFLEICQAVQHAHQKGVIHRDIKPSNILVSEHDGKPFPKIIDFGIAKATDQRLAEYSAFTQFGELVGTPEYMSPEQAELSGLNVDTTTDVYSLGVLLYQLLVGVLPFDGMYLREAGLVELLRIIREVEPPTPSNRLAGLREIEEVAANRRTDSHTIRRQLAGDPGWIISKAIEKEKNRRYASASDLAGDIRRYLTNLPVVARPPSASYHLKKFARRHIRLVASAATVFVVLIAGVVASTGEAVRARHAEAAATLAQSHAGIQARDALREKAVAESARAEALKQRTEAQRERSNAERRLRELQNLSRGFVNVYTAPSGANNADQRNALLAQNVRDSLLILHKEGLTTPGLNTALDQATADSRAFQLARDTWAEMPADWQSGETVPGEYRLGIDRSVVYSGKASVFIRSLKNNPQGMIDVHQEFLAARYLGKRLRFSGELRSAGMADGVGQLLVSVDQLSKTISTHSTAGWNRYQIVFDVPPDAQSIQLAIRMNGAGALWADALRFEEVSASLPLGPQRPLNLDFKQSSKSKGEHQ
jgi:serine/threonine protein kinase